ncbi:MAG: hypothetical protein O9276_19465 [Microcystis sp. LE17-20A]|jgi:hypothetical protein|uniref:hypothetical protein n=1 Tax=unclassified Microcystis TaxID=2643300 RepID=UPI0022BD7C8B|nr:MULTISPECIES: hypothetical protein [unclassified Microcystis]MCZ8040227.1 hypothetical protein [Microcystis sp. LE17-20A]MCZ8211168.1 hypothetical protein [Microcystis sp. LE19-8.1F]
MKEFTAILPLTIEITIAAKNRKEASLFFDDLYANITIENDGNQEIEIISDNLGLIENSWEIED